MEIEPLIQFLRPTVDVVMHLLKDRTKENSHDSDENKDNEEKILELIYKQMAIMVVVNFLVKMSPQYKVVTLKDIFTNALLKTIEDVANTHSLPEVETEKLQRHVKSAMETMLS